MHKILSKTSTRISKYRYPKHCYDMLYNLDMNGMKTWASNIKLLLYKYDYGHVWMHQCVGHVDIFVDNFQQRVTDSSM